MKVEEILSRCDHTLLSVTATDSEIAALIDDAIAYHTASVCIPPCKVAFAKKYAGGRMPICTVIGFPNGYNSTEAKCEEARLALRDGADELDMVINVGALKEGNIDYVENEVASLKEICGDKILKVIIETCLLTDEEKITMCEIVTRTHADFIKTSTGFSKGGATVEDVKLFKEHVGSEVGIKAAGGIRSFAAAEEMIASGATRLGTSALVKLMKENR